MSILDIFKSRKVSDSSPKNQAQNDKGMGGINYIDSHAYESRNINITDIAPIRSFDNMPHEFANMAYRNFSSWQNYAASIGVNNSLAQYSHHILNRLSYQECANLATDSMISKAIDVIVREIFKSGGKWTDTHLDIENFEMILNSLNFYDKVRLAVQRALEYGGAFIYINTDDTNLSLPLYLNEKTAGMNKVTGLTVIEPWQAAPVQVNSFNPLKDNYMEPDLWWVLGASTMVHKTRLIPILFYSVPDLIKPLYNYLGLPLSFYMKNYVSNADTVRQSISDLILRFRTKIIKTTAQKIADPQTQARVKYMNATSNNLATLLLAKDEEWIETVTTLSGMDNLLSQMYELMTASTRGIPVTKLLGLSPRGFNATGEYDENNFYDVIDGYAKSTVVPLMERLAEYILCFKTGILSEPKYEFNPRKQIRPKEQAEINNLKADYISKLIMSGVVTGKDAIKAISEDNFKFDWIDIEDYKMPDNPEVEKEIFNKWMDSYQDSSPLDSSLFVSTNIQNDMVYNNKVKDEWKESEHERDENGRFKSTGGASGESENKNESETKENNEKSLSRAKKIEELQKKREELQKSVETSLDNIINSARNNKTGKLSHKEKVDKVLSVLKENNIDNEKNNVRISENRYGQTSLYVDYNGYKIRISDHLNSDNFNLSDVRLSIDGIEEALPVYLEVLDITHEIRKLKHENEIEKVSKIRHDKKEEAEKAVKEYLYNFKDHPDLKIVQKMMKERLDEWLSGVSGSQFDEFQTPNPKERKYYVNNYKREHQEKNDG